MLTLCNVFVCVLQVEDTGRYTCLASSPAGDDDKEYLVRVHGKFCDLCLIHTQTYLETILEKIRLFHSTSYVYTLRNMYFINFIVHNLCVLWDAVQ